MRYCVVEATALFAAVRDKLEGNSDASAFCRGLVETEGVFNPPKTEVTASKPARARQEAEE
jgi:hypothetical protein